MLCNIIFELEYAILQYHTEKVTKLLKNLDFVYNIVPIRPWMHHLTRMIPSISRKINQLN